jgi:ATP-dependent Clp protease ATP-binding subunit ClpA
MTPIASTGQVPPDVGMAIAKKVLDTVEQQGNAMVGLIADGDSYVSTEHLLLALAEVTGARQGGPLDLRRDAEARRRRDRAAPRRVGRDHVTDQDAETQYEALKKYAIDLTEKAQQGKLDPVIGRDEEIRRTCRC